MMEEQNSKREGFNTQGKSFRTHDQPIIIDGTGSVTLEFDAGGDEHYVPDDPSDPTKYTGHELQITGVTVFVPGRRPHSCPVPSDGRCTVTVVGRATHTNTIVLDGATVDAIVIAPDRAYKKEDLGSGRKRHKSDAHKIESLTIRPIAGGEPHSCPAIPANGKCIIRIIDDYTS